MESLQSSWREVWYVLRHLEERLSAVAQARALGSDVIHFSVFGRNFSQRLVTQMYFPGDPLLAYDPIYGGIPDEKGRRRLISRFDLGLTRPEWALGYRFDLVLGGDAQTPWEEAHG